jgi:FixJ family two-component response regulator
MQQKIVAVVDDDPSILKAISRLLTAHHFQVEVSSSAEAFLANAASRNADCLVFDINLEKMSGLELRRRLTDSGSTIPVIFITAFDDERTRQEALEAGCVDYLRKPFLAHLLLAAVEKALGRAKIVGT